MRKQPVTLALAVAALLATTQLALAAGTVKVRLLPDGDKATVGSPTTISIIITGAKVTSVNLPSVNGLTLNGTGTNPNAHEYNFFVSPTRAGDFTIPAFDVKADDGEILHVPAIALHASAMQ
jgi:hypothetical protein